MSFKTRGQNGTLIHIGDFPIAPQSDLDSDVFKRSSDKGNSRERSVNLSDDDPVLKLKNQRKWMRKNNNDKKRSINGGIIDEERAHKRIKRSGTASFNRGETQSALYDPSGIEYSDILGNYNPGVSNYLVGNDYLNENINVREHKNLHKNESPNDIGVDRRKIFNMRQTKESINDIGVDSRKMSIPPQGTPGSQGDNIQAANDIPLLTRSMAADIPPFARSMAADIPLFTGSMAADIPPFARSMAANIPPLTHSKAADASRGDNIHAANGIPPLTHTTTAHIPPPTHSMDAVIPLLTHSMAAVIPPLTHSMAAYANVLPAKSYLDETTHKEVPLAKIDYLNVNSKRSYIHERFYAENAVINSNETFILSDQQTSNSTSFLRRKPKNYAPSFRVHDHDTRQDINITNVNNIRQNGEITNANTQDISVPLGSDIQEIDAKKVEYPIQYRNSILADQNQSEFFRSHYISSHSRYKNRSTINTNQYYRRKRRANNVIDLNMNRVEKYNAIQSNINVFSEIENINYFDSSEARNTPLVETSKIHDRNFQPENPTHSHTNNLSLKARNPSLHPHDVHPRSVHSQDVHPKTVHPHGVHTRSVHSQDEHPKTVHPQPSYLTVGLVSGHLRMSLRAPDGTVVDRTLAGPSLTDGGWHHLHIRISEKVISFIQ